jgi:hypothetical protein
MCYSQAYLNCYRIARKLFNSTGEDRDNAVRYSCARIEDFAQSDSLAADTSLPAAYRIEVGQDDATWLLEKSRKIIILLNYLLVKCQQFSRHFVSP